MQQLFGVLLLYKLHTKLSIPPICAAVGPSLQQLYTIIRRHSYTRSSDVRCTHTYETGRLYRHAMLTYLNWVGLTHGARQERVEVSLRPRRTPAHYLTKSKRTSLSRPGEILGGVGACRALGRKLPNSPPVYRPFIEMSFIGHLSLPKDRSPGMLRVMCISKVMSTNTYIRLPYCRCRHSPPRG